MPDIQMTKTTFILVECEARAADAVHCMIVLRVRLLLRGRLRIITLLLHNGGGLRANTRQEYYQKCQTERRKLHSTHSFRSED